MMAGVFEGDDGIEAFFHSHPNSDDDTEDVIMTQLNDLYSEVNGFEQKVSHLLAQNTEEKG